MSTSQALLAIRSLSLRYGAASALDRVDIEVGAGEAVALIGANGAGKSSLLKAVMGLVKPMAGEIVFDGRALASMPASARARRGIGYAPEGRRIFPAMSVRDNLAVACRDGPRARAERIESVYALFPQLEEKDRAPGWQLSGGQQQMLAIGRALMGAPRLLVLDEPSLGLSPILIDELFARIDGLAKGGTALLIAEQNAGHALAVAGRAYVLRLGRVVQSGTSAELASGDDLARALLGG